MNFMFLMVFLVIFLLGVIVFNFFYFLINDELKIRKELWSALQILVIFISGLFFFQNESNELNSQLNLCCDGSGTIFSIENRLGVYFMMILYKIGFLITIFKKKVLPPIIEVVLNILLMLGVLLNVILIFHISVEGYLFLPQVCINFPLIIMLIINLIVRQRRLIRFIDENKIESDTILGLICLQFLKFRPIIQFPILLVLVIPILVLATSILILIGQKPDALIKAFTDTYKHGFSQLSYECENVECGGHFLCSVGANGHKSIVKPIRYGERNGRRIICNRQLLISNAFEDFVQEKFPNEHKIIRSNYNKVGDLVHKYYDVFNIKLVSDIVYYLMKPLEWFFLVVLYCVDEKPENRIEKQYVKHEYRKKIDNARV